MFQSRPNEKQPSLYFIAIAGNKFVSAKITQIIANIGIKFRQLAGKCFIEPDPLLKLFLYVIDKLN